MGIIKTKPFDLKAIKNGAKWGVFGMGENPVLCYDHGRFLMHIFKAIDSKDLCLSIDGTIRRIIGDNIVVIGTGKYQILLIQEPKLASDLSEVKVGDKVWDFLYGWGTILTIESKKIIVEMDNKTAGTISYHPSGKFLHYNGLDMYNQTLFLTEIKFEIPKV